MLFLNLQSLIDLYKLESAYIKDLPTMKNLLLFSLSIILVGCGETTEKNHDVDYYKENAEARLEKLSWCEEKLDRKDLHNCKMAHQADSKAKINKMFGEGFSITN